MQTIVRKPTPSCELLECRLALMRQLAASLEQVQGAVVGSDLVSIDGHTVRQRELCEALRRLGIEILSGAPGAPVGGEGRSEAIGVEPAQVGDPPQIRQRWEALARELIQVEMQVDQLNRVYAALLRRARRIAEIFMRLRANSSGTYTRPHRNEDAHGHTEDALACNKGAHPGSSFQALNHV